MIVLNKTNHFITPIKTYLLDLQRRICEVLEVEENNARFFTDEWKHATGGGGITRILTGKVIEKAGVNFSHVYGNALPAAATLHRPELAAAPFEALGVSVVVHPFNPYAPTSHLNVRFICVTPNNSSPIWWFGGGFDLTPYYGFTEDCIHWHQMAKAACDPYGKDVYSRFKTWCDRYFFLKHRNEARGIGGIFYDDLSEWDFDQSFHFMQSVGEHYIKAYQPIFSRRKNMIFSERERQFQSYRRGRYVEFNLLYDRGTLFGLQSGGRTESILMSLPPQVTWHYNWQQEHGSPEFDLIEKFLRVKEWV